MNETGKWGTTLKLTAHLWPGEPNEYGFLTSACGRAHESHRDVQPTLPSDKWCARCKKAEQKGRKA